MSFNANYFIITFKQIINVYFELIKELNMNIFVSTYMLKNFLKYNIYYIKIFSILFLFVGHNFIDHYHSEKIDFLAETHAEDNTHSEHNDDDVVLDGHNHVFVNNSRNRSLNDINQFESNVYQEINTNLDFFTYQDNVQIVLVKSDKIIPLYLSRNLRDRSPPLS